jgi:hypothetical protein
LTRLLPLPHRSRPRRLPPPRRQLAPPLPHLSACLAVALAAAAGSSVAPPVRARASLPRIVEVASRPAFVRLPGAPEQPARLGQVLEPNTLLRTQKPGRLQVQLADGRSFRLGGDSVLRLGSSGLDLLRGQIIAWVSPGVAGRASLGIRTRVATASIEGTTVFIDAGAEEIRFFSWEGLVRVDTDQGKSFALRGGEQMAKRGGQWQLPRRLSRAEVESRRRESVLLNGFEAPMDTLPMLEKELGLLP